MIPRVAFHNGVWAPLEQTSLSLDDWGLVQGATLVERMRTVGGRPLDVEGHLERLRLSAGTLGIRWPELLDARLICETGERNCAAHVDQRKTLRDFAIVVLLTPGRSIDGPAGYRPTLIVHTVDMHWRSLAHWYAHGQALVTALNRNVPGDCWSTHLKTRSRLHYFLADQYAASSGLEYAGAAMRSTAGHLTESSVANILMIDGDTLVSPPIDSVLHGLSLRRTLRLAGELGIPARFENIAMETARSADALLMTGSSGCLWVASQLDDVEFVQPRSNPIFCALRDAWIKDIGLDYISQAIDQQDR